MRKPYCEVDVDGCTCDDGICHGKRHEAAISHYNTLRRYGLSAEEALDDMRPARPSTEEQ